MSILCQFISQNVPGYNLYSGHFLGVGQFWKIFVLFFGLTLRVIQ